MKELQELIKRVEVEINKTPTGELRNLLCDANIMLQQQALNIPVVVGRSEQLKHYTNFLYEKGYLEKDNVLIEYANSML